MKRLWTERTKANIEDCATCTKTKSKICLIPLVSLLLFCKTRDILASQAKNYFIE
jgi:hypothetical protein